MSSILLETGDPLLTENDLVLVTEDEGVRFEKFYSSPVQRALCTFRQSHSFQSKGFGVVRLASTARKSF